MSQNGLLHHEQSVPTSVKGVAPGAAPEGATFFFVPAIDVLILRFYACEFYTPEREGFLSVRCAFNGQRLFEVDGGRFAINDGSYLILNTGQRYASHIQSNTPVESFNLSFCPIFAEDVLRSLVTPADRLLDVPQAASEQSTLFFEKTYPHDDVLSPVLFRLRDAVGKNEVSRGWFEEQFHLALERLLRVHRKVGREVESLSAVRRSTRAETYLRLHSAKDFMDASLSQPLTLPQIAQVAWFSTHHFLRLFKQAFQVTPHQYLTQKRIERAKHLLATTDKSVTDVCLDVGFESLGSFSWLFRRRVGMSPEVFRSRSGIWSSRRRIWKGFSPSISPPSPPVLPSSLPRSR
jgi:AraC-like DNA-binding protein